MELGLGLRGVDSHHFAVLPLELNDLVGILFEQVPLMVADHEYLETECFAGIVNDFHQFWDQIGSKPAVLFVEYEEASVGRCVERRQGKDSEADTDDICHGASLTVEQILWLAVSLDPKIDARAVA